MDAYDGEPTPQVTTNGTRQMRPRTFALIATALTGLLAPSQVMSQTITPNLPGTPPDPCGPHGCPPPHVKLCKTVYVHECVEYQGSPPRCKRFQSVPHQECS